LEVVWTSGDRQSFLALSKQLEFWSQAGKNISSKTCVMRVSESENGFTSKQCKKVIYGREKHRKKGEIKEQNNRKVKRKIRLYCYFV